MEKPNPPPPLTEEEPTPKKQKMSTTTSDDEDFDPSLAAADGGAPPPERKRKYKRRKIAIFFAYCGVGYQGMQKNPGAKTIEGDLEEALFHAGAVPEQDRGQPRRYDWARSARTDKGVSAVGQVVSGRFYIDPPGLIERLNSNLSPQIRIFGYKRATASFNAKKFCDRRRYVYLIPVFALDPSAHRDRESVLASLGSGNEFVKCLECSERGRKVIGIMGKRSFDSKNDPNIISSDSGISSNTRDTQNEQENINNSIHSAENCVAESNPNSETEKKVGNETPQGENTDATNMEVEQGNEEAMVTKKIFCYGEEEKDRFNRILKYYEGTHNFHNFTTRTKAEDPAAKRYIISFAANTVVNVEGIDFVKCEVVGQSFMLHQIRKMIGLAVAIMRNCSPESLIETAFRRDVNINVPMAPEVGLYLDECFFTSYNKRWNDHEELSMKAYADEAEEFKMKYIYPHVGSTEHKEGVVGLWLHSLNYRNYPDLRFEITDAKRVQAVNAPDSCNGEALDAKIVEGEVVANSCTMKDDEIVRAKTIEPEEIANSCTVKNDETVRAKAIEPEEIADSCTVKNDETVSAKTIGPEEIADSCTMKDDETMSARTIEPEEIADSCTVKNEETVSAKTIESNEMADLGDASKGEGTGVENAIVEDMAE